MNHYKNNTQWKKEFCIFLKKVFDLYSLDYMDFSIQNKIADSTVRYWFYGRNLPRTNFFNDLIKYFNMNIKIECYQGQRIYDIVQHIFISNEREDDYILIRNTCIEEKQFVITSISTLYNYSKNNFTFLECQNGGISPTGRTQAVVFDFDGTLTRNQSNKTTWEHLWMHLGYNVKVCQKLHIQFDRNEITHTQWCKTTEDYFKERGLHRKTLEKIAREIKLIDGIEQTFEELAMRNIKIYIVSGSILYIIKHVLGSLYRYIEEAKANIFKFDDDGLLTEIVGTKYDFQGKATFIRNVANELNISPRDILFIGNSINDRFAYASGARTLCINPRLTDITNQTVWNECILTCDNLTEIFQHL